MYVKKNFDQTGTYNQELHFINAAVASLQFFEH